MRKRKNIIPNHSYFGKLVLRKIHNLTYCLRLRLFFIQTYHCLQIDKNVPADYCNTPRQLI